MGDGQLGVAASDPLSGPGAGIAALHGLFLCDWGREVAAGHRAGLLTRAHRDASMGWIVAKVRATFTTVDLGPVMRTWAPSRDATHDTEHRRYDVTREEAWGAEYHAVRCPRLGRPVGYVVREDEGWTAYHAEGDGEAVGRAEDRDDAVRLVTGVEDGYKPEDTTMDATYDAERYDYDTTPGTGTHVSLDVIRMATEPETGRTICGPKVGRVVCWDGVNWTAYHQGEIVGECRDRGEAIGIVTKTDQGIEA